MTQSATPNDAARERVVIFDTTMRDGEQSPGASMSLPEKLELAKILEEMRVDVIEAGFPIASNGDFEAVRGIAEIVTESTVCGLARAATGDIDRCAEALKPAKRGRIHTFISTSPVHMKHKLQMEPHQVLEAVIAGKRQFTKEQLEFTISEAMVLSGWELTPLELMAKGEVWLARQVLKNSGATEE